MTKVIKAIEIVPSQLGDVLKAAIKAKVNVYIDGPAGIGKTEITKQVCDELSLPLYTTRLADCEPSDLRGLPIVAGADEQGKPIMQFSRPKDIPPQHGACVWFLDELNRANRGVMNSVMQATDANKRVGDHLLSRDMVVIAAGNPSSNSGYDVNETDLALNNRFLHVIVKSDVASLVTYANKKQWDKRLISFIKANSTNIFTTNPEPGSPFCSPRSLERTNQVLGVLDVVGRDQQLAMLQGCIGAELGTELFSFLYELRPVTFDELKTDEGKDRLKKMSKDKGYRADLIGLTIDEIVNKMAGVKAVADEDAEAVLFLLTTIQKEQAASAIQSIAAKCTPVLQHKAIATSTKLRDALKQLRTTTV